MKIHKAITAVIAACMMLLMFSYAGQADAAVIEREGTPVKMVLTDWGGVSLNLQGQEKYFKVWEKSSGAYTRINLALTNIDSFDVDGRNLVYTISSGSAMDVYLYDIKTGANKVISKTFTAKRNVKIYGNRIAWVDYGIGSGGICIYNLTDGSATSLQLDKSEKIELDLTDGYLAYICNKNGRESVFLYNLTDATTEIVSDTDSNKSSVSISGTKVVWTEKHTSSGLGTASLYDWKCAKCGTVVRATTAPDTCPDKTCVSDKWICKTCGHNWTEALVAPATKPAKCPSCGETSPSKIWELFTKVDTSQSYYNQVFGNYLTGAVSDVWIYDKATGLKEQLTNDTANQVQPVIYDKYVAWSEISSGNADICLLNLETGILSKIANSDLSEVSPSLAANHVAWITLHGNLGSLYVENLENAQGSGSGQMADSEIKIMVNGQRFYTDPAPYIKDGRTMVPMRRVFEIMGAEVNWNEPERSVTAIKGNIEIKLYIGSQTAYKNGQPVQLDAPAEIMASAGRTMVPLRFVSESFGGNVNWVAATRTVVINTGI
ncbi:MAG: hypothetical protein GXY49_02315 [Syntrophomonadaceae bacterium]|nr:hypothetical protein [Syntrophomonadaceae bacterium]